MIVDTFPKPDMDRLVELAHAGAVQAGEAFAQLVGQPVTVADPVIAGEAVEPGADSSSKGVSMP